MTNAAIRTHELRHAYGAHIAVDGISFEVARGEILGFLGPNGAGKSTTIKVLTGQVPLQAGEVEILGWDRRGHRKAIQSRINVTFEEKNLYDDMSGKENLDFFARLYGVRAPRSEALLQRVGLADRMRDRVDAYSKGMRQRLMVARALVNDPDVLFLDEPTDGLDPVSARAIRELIADEARRGCAIMLTTHDMLEADQLSDRVGFINHGKLIALDTPERLKQQYGRRSVRVHYADRPDTHIALDDETASTRLAEAVRQPGLLSVHTEEATLEDLFVELAGRPLD